VALRRRPTWPTIAVLAGILALAAFNAWWYWSHRRGFPLFVDESGYTSFALDHTQALRHDGLRGLFDSYQNHSVQAPLVPLVTVPAQLVLGERIGAGFVVMLGFYALLVLATYAVARRLVTPWLAALAALLVATAPGVLTFARMYYFAVPVAAMFTAAIWCFLRSDALMRPGWVIAGGALLGLTVLSRTLALAPGVLLAAGVQAVAGGRPWLRRFVNLGASTLAAGAVAATWYVQNFENVLDYLTGRRFRGPEGQPGQFDPGRALREVGEVVRTVYLPLALVLAAVLVAALVVALARRRVRIHDAERGSTRQFALTRLADDRAFLGVVLIEAVAVATVTTFAVGQWLMLLPVLVTFAVAAVGSLPRYEARAGLAALLAGLAMFNVMQLSDVWATLGQPRELAAGPLGELTVTDGRQFVQQHVEQIDGGRPGRLRESSRRLLPLYRELTAWVLAYAAERHERPVVFTVGKESRLLKPNDLLLADRLLEKDGVLLVGRLFLDQNASARAYRHQLNDPQLGLPNFVITGPDPAFLQKHSAEELSPAEQKVDALGFRIVRALHLSDGTVRIWWRSQANVPSA
jgi:4-amino-4-deoxy-L-arabinose transferase-like glycosyltransferase